MSNVFVLQSLSLHVVRRFDVFKEIRMKKYRQGSRRSRARSVKKPRNVFYANLLNPDEVDLATRESPAEEREPLRGQWLLDGTVSRKMYVDVSGNFPCDLAAALTVFPTPMGAAYAVIATRIGAGEHRFVLPLFETKVLDFLSSLSRGPLNIRLGTEDGVDGRKYDCDVSQGFVEWVIDVGRSLDLQNIDEFMAELPTVLSAVRIPNLTPGSPKGNDIGEVYVSVLKPVGALAGQARDEDCTTT